ncbi:hypothetical protein FRB90_012750 [Tulasnella sp. 427]|nr:hypothetical protein FRB90_012750 [Tulasnella sp. 427]
MDIDQPLHHHSPNSDLAGQRTSFTTPASTLQPPGTPSSTGRMAGDVRMIGVETGVSSSHGAGPSTLPFYTIATVRKGPPHLRTRLHPSQDLITRLGLLPAFDNLVRPFIRVPGSAADGDGAAGAAPSVVDEKGKGKEVDLGRMQGVEGPDGQPIQVPPSAATGAAGPGKPDSVEDKKEHKNGWRSLVQPQVSGKFSTKKDTYLGDLVSYQARQPVKIRPFDLGTLKGFALEEGQLDAPTLQQLGLGPDDKKKKKKKKKLLADGTAAPADSTTSAGPFQAAASPAAPGLSSGGTPRSNPAAPSPRPTIHPAYLKANSSPYPQSNRPPLPQTPSQPPSNYAGANGNGGHYWHGQPVPPEANGPPKPPGAAAVMLNGKAARVRKERDEGPSGPGTPGGLQAGGGQGQAGQPRPHKKRKMDGSSGGAQHHGMATHHQQQQPMQQATPTF